MKQKVFCIGFHKTGTKSIGLALQKLGYKVTGPNGTKDVNIEKNVYDLAYSLVEAYDAFQDNPWPIIFKTLDEKYPDSKFIYTYREPDNWFDSQIKHFGTKETPMRKWIYGYGSPVGNEEVYLHRFKRHHHEVMEHFKERSEDLLIMNLQEGDGWEELCHFLEVKVPHCPFPHINKASDRENNSSTKV